MSAIIRYRMARLRNKLLAAFAPSASDPALAAAIGEFAERLQAHLDAWDSDEQSSNDIRVSELVLREFAERNRMGHS